MLDRFTAYSAVGGALMGAKDYPPITALVVAVAMEAWETARIGPQGATLEHNLANVVAAMGGWYLARRAVRR